MKYLKKRKGFAREDKTKKNKIKIRVGILLNSYDTYIKSYEIK